MRVLVTGATGFIAGHLIPALQRRGHEVHALVQPSSEAGRLHDADVAVHAGDVRSADTLRPAMRQVDAVVHLAAAIGLRAPLSDYHAVNVAGTQNVCRAALAAGIERLVHVSSTSVYKQGLGVPVDESYAVAPPPDPYAVTKAAGDRLVQRLIADEQLPASVVRTSTVYGPGDHLNFARIADRVRSGSAIVIGSGRNRVPFAYVDDVVEGLVLALEHDAAQGEIYNITDDRCPTQLELLRAVARELDAKRPRVHVPYGLLYGAGYLAERIAQAAHSQSALITRFGVVLYGADNVFAIDKARRELGYEPRVSLGQGIRAAADWYRGRTDRGGARPEPVLATMEVAS
jgi:nucleoside-diphosphate-sugar epimerase